MTALATATTQRPCRDGDERIDAGRVEHGRRDGGERIDAGRVEHGRCDSDERIDARCVEHGRCDGSERIDARCVEHSGCDSDERIDARRDSGDRRDGICGRRRVDDEHGQDDCDVDLPRHLDVGAERRREGVDRVRRLDDGDERRRRRRHRGGRSDDHVRYGRHAFGVDWPAGRVVLWFSLDFEY